MNEQLEIERLVEILDVCERAFERADPDLMESLFWRAAAGSDQPGDEMGRPAGAAPALSALSWLHECRDAKGQMRFHDTCIYLLTPTVAYGTSLRDTIQDGQTATRRVGFIFLKRCNAWKIVHAHFSIRPA